MKIGVPDMVTNQMVEWRQLFVAMGVMGPPSGCRIEEFSEATVPEARRMIEDSRSRRPVSGVVTRDGWRGKTPRRGVIPDHNPSRF